MTTFRKSSFSAATCVEVAQEWAAFVAGVRNNEFDLTREEPAR